MESGRPKRPKKVDKVGSPSPSIPIPLARAGATVCRESTVFRYPEYDCSNAGTGTSPPHRDGTTQARYPGPNCISSPRSRTISPYNRASPKPRVDPIVYELPTSNTECRSNRYILSTSDTEFRQGQHTNETNGHISRTPAFTGAPVSQQR